MGCFRFPEIALGDVLTSLSAGDVAKCSHKVRPSTKPGIEREISWLAVKYLTNCANLAHTCIHLSLCLTTCDQQLSPFVIFGLAIVSMVHEIHTVEQN